MFRHRKFNYPPLAMGKQQIVAEVPNETKDGTFIVKKDIDYSDPLLSKAMPSPDDTNLANLLAAGILPQEVKASAPSMGQFAGDNLGQVLNVLETNLNTPDQTAEEMDTTGLATDDNDNTNE